VSEPERVSRRRWEHYLRGPESTHLGLTCVDACILYAVGTWMDDDGSNAYVGIPKIAGAVRKSPATVKRTLAKAKTVGLLTVTARGHRRGDGTKGDNAYAATIPTSTAHLDEPESESSTAHLDEPETPTSPDRPDEPKRPASTAQIEPSTAHPGVSTAQIGPPIGDRGTTTQAAAAAGGIIDQQGEGEPDPRAREILTGCGRHPHDRPWLDAAREALARGGTVAEIVTHVMAEITPGRNGEPVRSPEAVRLHRLRTWPGAGAAAPGVDAHDMLARLGGTGPNGATTAEPPPTPPTTPEPAAPPASGDLDPAPDLTPDGQPIGTPPAAVREQLDRILGRGPSTPKPAAPRTERTPDTRPQLVTDPDVDRLEQHRRDTLGAALEQFAAAVAAGRKPWEETKET
jgi:hypothetical protein